MIHTVILALHIAMGVVGVAFGPFAIAEVARGRVNWLTSGYHLSVAGVCASAVGLAALDPARLWWFVLIAAGSYFFAARAMRDIRSARVQWQGRAVRGFGGAYIALWTAVVVVSLPAQPLLWAIPTAIGIPALEWFATRIVRRLPTQSIAG
ncbi:MAG: hypothetical protein M3492_10615 [Actinomycetota bacterium]|nr:hypothetical protein [Actinomycetota bacterium]